MVVNGASTFLAKGKKSGQANLRNKAPRNPIGKFILFA